MRKRKQTHTTFTDYIFVRKDNNKMVSKYTFETDKHEQNIEWLKCYKLYQDDIVKIKYKKVKE